MSTLSEKRVYAERGEPTPVYVAAEQGLARAKLSGDAVGEFSLARRCTARDVEIGEDGLLALATTEATLVGGGSDELRETEFGAAVAVSFPASTDGIAPGSAGALVAADESGRVAQLSLDALEDGTPAQDDWTELGAVEGVRTIDGSLVAAEDGVFRVLNGEIDDAGLSDARDVAARGAPLAATGKGLYELGNGWMVAREGAHDVVATDSERAHAVDAAGTLLAREGREWIEATQPEGELADVAYTEDGVVVATESGSLAVDAGDGWRSRAIGVTGVQALAAARTA